MLRAAGLWVSVSRLLDEGALITRTGLWGMLYHKSTGPSRGHCY